MYGRDTFSIPFVGGLDTKSDEKTVQPPALTTCENAVFTKGGSVKKRTGYSAVSTTFAGGSVIGTPIAVAGREDEKVLITSRRVYGFDTLGDRWVERGPYSNVIYQRENILGANSIQQEGSIASTSGISLVSWTDGTGVYCSVRNQTSGSMYEQKIELTSSGVHPKTIALKDRLAVYWAESGVIKMRYFRTDSTSNLYADIQTSTTDTVVSDLSTSAEAWDVVAANDDRQSASIDYAILYWNTDNSVITGTRMANVDLSGNVDTTTYVTVNSAQPPGGDLNFAVVINRTNYEVLCMQKQLAGLFVVLETFDYAYQTTPTSNVAQTTSITGSLHVTMGGSASGDDWLIWTDGSCYVYDTATLTQQATVAWGDDYDLIAYNLQFDSRGYLVIAYNSPTGVQNQFILIDDQMLSVGTMLYVDAYPDVAHNTAATGWPRSVNGEEFILGWRRSVDVEEDNVYVYEHQGLAIITLDTDPEIQTQEFDGVLYITGSQLWAYDGISTYPATFGHYPEMTDFTSTASGSLTQNAQYNFRAYFEWRNGRGHRIRSNALDTSFVTTGTGLTCTIRTIPSFFPGRTLSYPTPVPNIHDTRPALVVYRTEGNKSDLYYRITAQNPDTWLVAPEAGSTTFSSGVADSTIISYEVDYKSRGELGDDPVGGCSVLGSVGGRAFISGCSVSDNHVLASKDIRDNEPLRFNLNFVITDAPREGGKIVGIYDLNGTPVVFKERSIYVLVGDGPDVTGTGGSYSSQSITSDVGLEDKNSVVRIPSGLIFKSKKGFYHLDESFNVSYIGAPVESYNSQTYKAAHVLPDSNTVVFLASSGSSLIYDYFYGQWGVWTNHTGISATVVAGTTYMYLRGDGTVYQADSSLYQDNGTSYKLKLKTAPIRPPDMLQGHWLFHKYQVLGEYRSDHDLKVSLYYDRDTATTETYTWDMAAGDYQHEHVPKRTKCQSVRLEFEEATAVSGQGYELTEIAVEYSKWSGLSRIAATRQY